MRVPTHLAILGIAAATLACGDGDRSPPAEEPATDIETADTARATEPARPADTAGAGDVTLLQSIPNGSPMPAASRTGIPPYPDATVHTRFPRERSGIQSFEAFTPDSPAVVEAYYDTTLGRQWTKVEAEDTTVYEKGDDVAAITLSAWNSEKLPEGDHPTVMRNARTIIGAAWRTDSP